MLSLSDLEYFWILCTGVARHFGPENTGITGD